jgi:hypothetical protein
MTTKNQTIKYSPCGPLFLNHTKIKQGTKTYSAPKHINIIFGNLGLLTKISLYHSIIARHPISPIKASKYGDPIQIALNTKLAITSAERDLIIIN